MLFDQHKKIYSPTYNLLITEISTKNYRSQKAHEKLDFPPYKLTPMPWIAGMQWFGIGDSAK